MKEVNQSNLYSKQWTTQLVCHLWQYVMDLWKYGNDALHGKTKLSTWHIQNVQDAIKALYQQKEKIDCSNQYTLEGPINIVLNKQTNHMEEWLKQTTPRVTIAIQ